MNEEAADIVEIEEIFTAGLQFKGQSHELTVRITDPKISVAALREVFEEAYWQRFRVRVSDARAVLVSLHTGVVGHRKRIDLRAFASKRDTAAPATAEPSRQVWFESGWCDTTIHRREALLPGTRFEGPAIVEQLDTTVLVEPGQAVEVDTFGNLIIDVRRP